MMRSMTGGRRAGRGLQVFAGSVVPIGAAGALALTSGLPWLCSGWRGGREAAASVRSA